MPTLCVQHPFGWFPTDLVSFLDAVLPGRLSGLLYTNHRRFPLLFLRRDINGGLLPSSLLELISLRIPWVFVGQDRFPDDQPCAAEVEDRDV